MDGEKLKDLRKDAGMTQADLAKHLKLSLQTIKTYEQGRSDPDDKTKLELAKLFNVSLDYLLGATDEQIPLCHSARLDLPKGLSEDDVQLIKDYVRLVIDAKNWRKK